MPPWALALVPNAIDAVSNIFGKKSTQTMPQYQAPPSMAQQMPAYAQMFASMPGLDPTSGPAYQNMLASLQAGGALPDNLRGAILGQAQNEATNAYNAANNQLTFDQGRANRQALEDMNAHGLAGSGALGVRQGLIDDSYARQRGVLAGNLQNQMGAASANLMQQQFSNLQRIQSTLAGMDQNRSGALMNFANADLGRQMQNAQNQYGSQMQQYNANQAYNGNLFDNLKSAFSTYAMYNPASGGAGNIKTAGYGALGGAIANARKSSIRAGYR